MRLGQLKSPSVAWAYDQIIIADVFSGSGENILSAHDDPIDGSPLRLLHALTEAVMTKRGPNPMALADRPVRFLFSDIRSEAIAYLNQLIPTRWARIPGLDVSFHTATLQASSAIQLLRETMTDDPRAHLILVLDPNGPKDFPRDEVLDLLRACSGRMDVVPYISATAINRCLRHRDQCGAHYNWWLSAIDRFDTGFVNAITAGRAGWVREPVQGDPQKWLMLPTFTPRLVPRNDWAKQGYVEINSARGQAAIAAYANIKEVA
jgi:three-Cys-motif partner protein